MLPDFHSLKNCTLCPRNCGVNRFSDSNGYCRTGSEYHVSSIVKHIGEEPLISGKNGICNIFFSHCNLQCVYCQNHQISTNSSAGKHDIYDFREIVSRCENILNQGSMSIGFVSPTHQLPQMLSIIHHFEKRVPRPVFVYNSNGYDKTEVLRELEGVIDVYLPDFKYAFPAFSEMYSHSKDYPDIALKAIKEMYRQKGPVLHTGKDNDYLTGGMIIRHLVLPGHIDNSKRCLEMIAEELSVKVCVSLMSQYYPAYLSDRFPLLNRTLYKEEYSEVIDHALSLGFENLLIQQMDSNETYRPDFEREKPFEDDEQA